MCKVIKGDNKKILPTLIEDIKKLADKKRYFIRYRTKDDKKRAS